MSTVDKNKAIISFLSACPDLSSNPLFFNYINAKEDSTQIITQSNDKNVNKNFIDGSILKRYTFTFIYFKAVAYNPIVKEPGYADKNESVEDYADVQMIIDWVTQQNKNKNYPNFGPDCLVEDMEVLTENPSLNSIDTTATPPLAKYSMSIQVEYLDITDRIWNN